MVIRMNGNDATVFQWNFQITELSFHFQGVEKIFLTEIKLQKRLSDSK